MGLIGGVALHHLVWHCLPRRGIALIGYDMASLGVA